jgi:hypothetical protein
MGVIGDRSRRISLRTEARLKKSQVRSWGPSRRPGHQTQINIPEGFAAVMRTVGGRRWMWQLAEAHLEASSMMVTMW